MHRFSDFRIRTKLIMIMVGTGTCVLLLAMGAMVFTSYERTRATKIDELETLVSIVGWNSGAALAFDDRKAAEATLASLGEKQSITAACLYDKNGERFAAYGEHASLETGQGSECRETIIQAALDRTFDRSRATVSTHNGELHILQAVELYGEHMGVLHITDDQSELNEALQEIVAVTGVIFIVAVGLVYLLSSRLQRVFSTPVHGLIRAMRDVAEGKDYSTRVERMSRDEFGELTGVFNGMLGEIEERDRQLAAHRRGLEKQVADRTAELSDAVAELRSITAEAVEARDAAEAASLAKSEFLATMSHEIRTPMNGVLGMTELLIGSGLVDRQAHYASSIQRSGRTLLGIINEILDFSKIESGKLEIDQHDFDLREVIEETAEMMAETAQRKGLELTVDLPVDLSLLLRGDSQRLRQVLLNLLGNAVKFTAEGDINVKLKVLNEAPQTLGLRCEVRDTGIGIPENARDEIFHSFQQADGSTTRRFGGTGLGLAISRQLLDLMDGRIGVESREGHGSTFWFELDLERQTGAHIDKPADFDSLGDLKILVVDDNAINREILQTQTTNWGMNCLTVDNADAGLQELRRAANEGEPYDGAILDWQMPDVDGIELARRIRGDMTLSEMRLAMLSSAGFDDESLRAAGVGVDCYLNKPVRQELLFRSLCRIFHVEPAFASSIEEAATTATTDFVGARILLAEDNPMNQEVAEGMLEIEGCAVVVVNNGCEAVDAYRSGDFDLVMMDCHMPEMDGFAAAGSVRDLEKKNGSERRIPIVALTADVQKGIQEQCLVAGMDDYLSKPFTAEQLRGTLQKWLGDISLEGRPMSTPKAVPASVPKPAGESEPGPGDASGAPIDDTVLDRTAIDRILQVEKQVGRPILASVVGKFLDGFDASLAAVLGALSAGDADALFRAAHFMKSGFANLGALRAADLCKRLEDAGRNTDLEAASTVKEEFETECKRVRGALEPILEQKVHV